MVQLQSTIAKRLQNIRNLFQDKVQASVYAVRHSSHRVRLIFGSAFALAFLIAPAAALMLGGNPSNSLNNSDSAGTDPGSTSPTDAQANAQSSAASSPSDNIDSSSGTSTNVNVNNGTTTVSIDGKTVVGPTTGPVSKTINTNNHQTTITVQRNGSTTTTTTANNSLSSNSNVNISTNTYSNTESSP